MTPASSYEFLDIQANYRVWTHSETHTWHENSIQSPFQIRTLCLNCLSIHQFHLLSHFPLHLTMQKKCVITNFYVFFLLLFTLISYNCSLTMVWANENLLSYLTFNHHPSMYSRTLTFCIFYHSSMLCVYFKCLHHTHFEHNSCSIIILRYLIPKHPDKKLICPISLIS